jgi:uncharacterized protein
MRKLSKPFSSQPRRLLDFRSARLSLSVLAIFWGWSPALAAQEPNYTQEEVAFASGRLQLKGTLFLPRQGKPSPGVVLVHGSGETKRSDSFFYAQFFARHGIAALAYDKRGVGESQGDPQAWRYFSLDDLAADAAAGLSFLQQHKRIDARRVGIFGGSQGGWVAPLAAVKSKGVAFLVLVSASVSTLGEDWLFERAARLRMEGFTDEEIAEVRAMQLIDQEVTRTGKRFAEFQARWEQHQSRRWFRRVYLSETPMGIDHAYRRWERTVLDFDPVPLLRQLDAPIYWLYGDPNLDRFAPVQLSLERIETLRRSGKPYEVRVFEGADHNLRMVKAQNTQAQWESPLFAWLTKQLKRD